LRRSSSGVLDVRRLLALRAGGDFEADLLAFLEGLEALHVDRGEVREQIVAAVIRSDEAVALRVVEPLDGASCHDVSLKKLVKRGTPDVGVTGEPRMAEPIPNTFTQGRAANGPGREATQHARMIRQRSRQVRFFSMGRARLRPLPGLVRMSAS